jgi:hypothetical protein
MKNTILTELFQSNQLEKLLSKMNPPHLRDDLKQELFLILCDPVKSPESLITSLYEKKQLNYYVTRIVFNMIASNTSPFFKKFRGQFFKEYREWHELHEEFHQSIKEKEGTDLNFINVEKFLFKNNHLCSSEINEVEEKEIEHNNLLNAVNQCLDGLPQYERELFKLYVEKGSAGKVIKDMKETTNGYYIPKRSILLTVKKVKDKIKKDIRA